MGRREMDESSMPGHYDCGIYPGYWCNIGVCAAEDEYWWSNGWNLSGTW
jgi:hypothetical protein